MIPSAFLPVANHLWQSTLFATAAGLLTLLFKNNRAHVRYGLWLAASVKFLVPFSVLMMVGGLAGRHAPIAPARSNVPVFSVPVLIEQVNEPFVAEGPVRPTPHAAQPASWLVPTLAGVWGIGFGVLVFSWWLRWWRMRLAVRAALPVDLAVGVPALSSASFMEPGIFGFLRPVLLLPEGITDKLTGEELRAILAHELCHVRRRDNLATALHMLVEAVFWFHPLVWWLGARLMDERERACDEEVLLQGSKPEAYATGILKICELCLSRYTRGQSPLECVAGVTGANLNQRIEAIMGNRSYLGLGFVKRAGLAVAGTLAIAIPVILGLTNAPLLRAQADPNLRFEVATVRRVDIDTVEGRSRVFPPTGGPGTSDPAHYMNHGAWLMNLITEAFGVRADRVTGLGSATQERYDIAANIPEGATKEQFNVMLGNLLRDRFHLRFHIESKVIPVYALRVGKSGPKFKETARKDDPSAPARVSSGRDTEGFPILTANFKGITGWPTPGAISWAGQDVPMANLAQLLEGPELGRPVVDETGLTAHYDFKIRLPGMRRPGANPGDASDPAPSTFRAVQEQLGLKLEPSTAPFDHLIIENIDRDPTDN